MPGTRPFYLGNPSRGPRCENGKKVRDAVTGFWTYEAYLVTDLDGNRVDGRDPDAYDARYDLDFGQENQS